MNFERHACRRLLPFAEEPARDRPRRKEEDCQHGGACPVTLATRRERSQGWTLRSGRARPRGLRRVGQELADLLGEHRIDKHELGADWPEVVRVRFEVNRRLLDSWASVHRNGSFTSASGRRRALEDSANGAISRS